MEVTEKQISRRRFGQRAAGLGALAAAPAFVPSTVMGRQGATSPSDKIIMGGIGVGSRGRSDLNHLLNDERAKFVAIADIWEERRELVKSTVDEFYGNNDCVTINDADELLAREDIEAVLIATSDRWHTLMAIRAAQAGKDMYCEKPAAICIAECYALAENIERYGTVYQAGCQRRNAPHYEYVVGLARSGKLGQILEMHAQTNAKLTPLGHSWWAEESPEPDKDVFDWDAWLGPCLWRPYNEAYPNGGRGSFWDFHGGILEAASHTVDICQWAANLDHTNAVEYDSEPDAEVAYGWYANGIKLVGRQDGWLYDQGVGACPVRIVGTEGWVETGDGGNVFYSESLSHMTKFRNAEWPRSGPETGLHMADFLNCVRSRSTPRANARSVANAHITSHAAYIACQLGRKLRWDPEARSFINDEEANRLRSRAYREPWRVDAISDTM